MKFPRNARVFRGSLDFTPYAAVFFLLVLFVMLSSLVHTPGVRLELPVAEDLPGIDKPSVTVAMDAAGRLYFQNQLVEPDALRSQLSVLAKKAARPITLVVQADKTVTYDNLIQLAMLAREAGIHDTLLATLPRMVAAPAAPLPAPAAANAAKP
jgi:biopolymer transport protein ExbD